jgi:nuclear pore complex protein Nup107
MIQDSLINGSLDELTYNVGIALTRAANQYFDPLLMPSKAKCDEKYIKFVEDQQALRVLTHLYLLYLKGLGMTPSIQGEPKTTKTIITGYVQNIKDAGKLDLLPIYCGQLEHPDSSELMAKILPDVHGDKHQKRFVRVMKSLGIPLVSTMRLNLNRAIQNAYRREADKIERFTMLEDLKESNMPQKSHWPGRRIIHGFIENTISERQEAIIESLQWFLYADEEAWEHIFIALTKGLESLLGMYR